jgi:hypothetical protein
LLLLTGVARDEAGPADMDIDDGGSSPALVEGQPGPSRYAAFGQWKREREREREREGGGEWARADKKEQRRTGLTSSD